MKQIQTISRDVTPEHAEEIRSACQSAEINNWTVTEIEEHVTNAERDACFHVRGNSPAVMTGWAYILFPSNQERDADGLDRKSTRLNSSHT